MTTVAIAVRSVRQLNKLKPPVLCWRFIVFNGLACCTIGQNNLLNFICKVKAAFNGKVLKRDRVKKN